MDLRPPRSSRSIHNVRQDHEPPSMKRDHQDKSFDLVKIKYLNLDNLKSVIFTKLESSTSQRRVYITYKIDAGANGNLMPFKNFKTFFPKSKQGHCLPQRTT